MPQSTYSWMGTPLHLVLEDDFAEAYNRAQDKWFEAQRMHREMHGRDWDPLNEPIHVMWDDEEHEAWNRMADLINHMIEINDGSLKIDEEEITSDYLVKLETS